MKRINALLILAMLGTPALFAQEMPADLTAKLEAKSAQLNAGNASAAKSWLKKQIGAWETIQNMSFSADENDIKEIKANADKKFPLDYVKQESYVNEQSIRAGNLAEYKVSLGAASYAAIRNAFKASGKTDFNELLDILATQGAAKGELDIMKPQGDEMTFAIAKEVIAKKFPGDYVAQLAALKKQFAKSQASDNPLAAAMQTPTAASTTAMTTDTAPVIEQQKKDKPMTIADLNKISRDMFTRQTFVVEGSKKSTGIAAEVDGKQAVIIPFTSYSTESKVSIMNNLGEEVTFDENDIFASKKVPVMIIFPKTVPSDTANITFPTESQYRELVGKNVFFVGYTSSNIQSFPIKINAIGDPLLTLSTRIPTNFQEGTVLLSPESTTTLGILTVSTPIVKEVNWKDRSSVNRFLRSLDHSFVALNCIRLDKIGDLERVNPERFKEEAKKIESLRALSLDLIKVFGEVRFDELVSLPIIGKMVEKHRRDLGRKQEKSRFDRLCRQYIQEFISLVKTNLKDYKPETFYTAHRVDAMQFDAILKNMLKTFETGLKNGNYNEMIPYDAKRAQEK